MEREGLAGGPRPGPLGTLWLVSVLAGPFLGWMVGGKVTGPFSEGAWAWRVGLRVALGVAWPLAAALAHGYAARRAWRARFHGPPVAVSGLVALASLNAVLDLARGPEVAEVTVARVRTVGSRGRTGRTTTTYRLVLGDGTEVVSGRVSLRPGARVRLTWLRRTEVALRVDPLP